MKNSDGVKRHKIQFHDVTVALAIVAIYIYIAHEIKTESCNYIKRFMIFFARVPETYVNESFLCTRFYLQWQACIDMEHVLTNASSSLH